MLLVYNFCKLKAAGRLKLLHADNISKLVATYFSCLHLQDSSFWMVLAATAASWLLLLYLHDYFMLLQAETC